MAGVKQTVANLTVRQKEYVDFVGKFWSKKGYGPSETDIAQRFLVSQSAVHSMIVRLCERGALIRDEGINRSLRQPHHSGKATRPPPGSWVFTGHSL